MRVGPISLRTPSGLMDDGGYISRETQRSPERGSAREVPTKECERNQRNKGTQRSRGEVTPDSAAKFTALVRLLKLCRGHSMERETEL